jgi:hypothetical protein
MRLRHLIPLALIISIAGCTDIGAINDTREDQHDFGLAGPLLVIDNHGGDLRLVAGTGETVAVQRSLTGKATVKGNATWSMAGDTLRLGVTCSGFVPDCAGLHVVSVPPGVAVRVTSDGPVRAVELGAALTATVSDGWLKVERPAGPLRLSAEFAVDVTDARSAEVTASSGENAVHLGFAAAPTRVEARAAGSVRVTLPAGPETYRVTTDTGRSEVASDPTSKRSVAAHAGEGYVARVGKVS